MVHTRPIGILLLCVCQIWSLGDWRAPEERARARVLQTISLTTTSQTFTQTEAYLKFEINSMILDKNYQVTIDITSRQ